MKSYQDVIRLLETNPQPVYVPVFYITGTHEWFRIDKEKYLQQLKNATIEPGHPFPCWFEVEQDGEMFIHPRVENR